MESAQEIQALKELAALDRRRRDLESLASSLPAAIESRRAALAARRDELAKFEAELEKAQKERRRLEAAVEDQNRLLVKYRGQLDTVNTNKEYQSLQHEIEVARQDIHKAEDRLLEVMDQLDGLQRDAAARRDATARVEAEAAAADAADQDRLREVEVQLVEVEEKRKRLIPQFSPPLRNEYQRVFEHYHGAAFAVARDGVCQGCFVNIPAKVVSDLHAGTKLYRCESCGRFILEAEEEWRPPNQV